MSLLETIRTAWSFTGLEPARVVDTNLFGNVLIEDVDGAVWRIFPEELSCEKIADDRAQFSDLQKTEDFVLDWEMETLVVAAQEKFGALPPGRCYCFKVPGVLGGPTASTTAPRSPSRSYSPSPGRSPSKFRMCRMVGRSSFSGSVTMILETERPIGGVR